MKDLRRRSYTELSEAITVMGVEYSADVLLKRVKKLVPKLINAPDKKVELKRMLKKFGEDILKVSNSIDTKETFWQKVRGY